MGHPEYEAASNRLSSALPQKVEKELRDKSFEKKIMSDKGVIFGVRQ